jgi:hypothetical protein
MFGHEEGKFSEHISRTERQSDRAVLIVLSSPVIGARNWLAL